MLQLDLLRVPRSVGFGMALRMSYSVVPYRKPVVDPGPI